MNLAKLAASSAASAPVVSAAEVTKTADGANPHLWYSPTAVTAVADAVLPEAARAELGAVDAHRTLVGRAAIALGIARAVLMAGLAWFQARRQRPTPPDHHPDVSVIIPAYNEERVIVASVRRVLESDYPRMEVIVADDGSPEPPANCWPMLCDAGAFRCCAPPC